MTMIYVCIIKHRPNNCVYYGTLRMYTKRTHNTHFDASTRLRRRSFPPAPPPPPIVYVVLSVHTILKNNGKKTGKFASI